MFKATEEGIKETTTNYLNMPYLGPAQVESVKIADTKFDTDCFIVEFTLLGKDVLGNPVSGHTYSKIEKDPTDNEDPDRVSKAVNRVAYFVAKFFPDEKQGEILAIQGVNWKDFCRKMIQYLDQTQYIGKEVNIKVTGSISNKGNTMLSAPGYPGWIYTDGQMPSFNKKELEGNNEYITALSAKPSIPQNDGSTTEVDSIGESVF